MSLQLELDIVDSFSTTKALDCASTVKQQRDANIMVKSPALVVQPMLS
jgi:hypothetical protein